MAKNIRFRHESLQNKDTIGKYLKALTEAVAKGEILLEDEDGSLELHPNGLIHFKVTGTQEDNLNRVNIRLSWQSSEEVPKNKKLKIS